MSLDSGQWIRSIGSGSIWQSLSFVQWVRWTILHWIRPCLAHIDKEWTRRRISFHRSFVMSLPISYSPDDLTANSEEVLREKIMLYPHEMTPFDVGGGNRKASMKGFTGRDGNWGIMCQVKLWTCKYKKINKRLFGTSNLAESCWTNAKVPSIYKSLKDFTPRLDHMEKSPSGREGQKA